MLVRTTSTGRLAAIAAAVIAAFSVSCNGRRSARVEAAPPLPIETPHKAAGGGEHIFRATGTVQALRSLSIRVPSIAAQRSQLTLTRLVPNGARVTEGAPIIEFDPTTLLDEAREAKAKLDEITHQKDERSAKAHSDSAKRLSLIGEAEADLAKAQIQLKKGPVLSDIERRKTRSKRPRRRPPL